MVRSSLRGAGLGLASLLAVAAVAGCGGSDSTSTSDAAEGGGKIVAANYGGVSGEAVKRALAQPFSEASGIEVQEVNVSTGFAAKLQAQRQAGNIGWDVIEGLSGQEAALLWEERLLEPLPAALRRELEAVSLPGAVTEYGVTLGDTGIVIACNREVVERCPSNPAEFWDTRAFPGRRAMMDNPFQTPATALVADGVETDAVFPMDVDRAFDKLDEIKPSIDVWTTSGDQQMQVMRDGEVGMSVMWNGRAKSLIDEGVPLQLEWEGSLVNPNYMVVVRDGPNTEGAFEYLEWYGTHPRAQAQLAREMTYGMAHKETLDQLTEEEAALLPAAHADDQVLLQPDWWIDNADVMESRWKEYVAG